MVLAASRYFFFIFFLKGVIYLEVSTTEGRGEGQEKGERKRDLPFVGGGAATQTSHIFRP